MVQKIGWGQKVPGSGNMFLRLKEKGDQVQFRIAQEEPGFTGKHFIQKETGWDVPTCLRVTADQECDNCNKYFAIMGKIKKLKAENPELKDESPEIKKLKSEARPFQVTIEVYVPILDRGDGKFKILQTTNGVKNKFNTQIEAGSSAMETEWLLKNTGSVNPNERYFLAPIDSSKVKPFTPEEEEEWKKAQGYDLTSIGQEKDPTDDWG